MIGPPSPTGGNGHVPDRDARGRFAPGNRAGRGNPLGQRVQQLRAALLAAVEPEALERIARALVKRAERGDVGAAKLVLAYSLGPAQAWDVLERLEEVERQLAEASDAQSEN
jgi:hypothetical protein